MNNTKKNPHSNERGFFFGRGRRTRTHDPWFWRPVLYQLSYTPVLGAGDGNRTRTASLEGWNSTIELHPHLTMPYYNNTHNGNCQVKF